MRKGDGHTTQRLRSARTLAPSSRGACMVVISGNRLGQCIDLHDVPVVIGRAPGSDFQIEHRSVSRAHCKVYPDGGKFCVRDLGSTNKTLINARARRAERVGPHARGRPAAVPREGRRAKSGLRDAGPPARLTPPATADRTNKNGGRACARPPFVP